MKSQQTAKGTPPEPFAGFENLDANFIYTPNQFFDVCLRHSSRGTVRLVAYLLRRTLGWLDKNGEPIEQDVAVSFSELVADAGISRGAIRPAIDEAIDAGFVTCTRPGHKGATGCAAQTAQYRLRWDERTEYVKDPRRFAGFFAGEGNRTPIPNSFFDHVVRREPLAVVKLVGTVLRHTVGHQNQFGGRRSDAPLSYTFIQNYANLKHRPTLAEAIRTAIASGYMTCVEAGVFDPTGQANRPATYAVRWLGQAASSDRSSKTEPVQRGQFKNRTGSGSESEPAEQFKNRTDRKTELKDTHKQQPEQPAVAADSLEAFQLLRDAGFDEQTAAALSQSKPANEIEQQIRWLPLRNVQKNQLGLLRRAIEENWAKPSARGLARTAKPQDRSEHNDDADHEKRRRLEQRDALARQWQALDEQERGRFYEQAIDAATSEFMRSRLQKHRSGDQRPPLEVLQLLASRTKAPIGESS